MSKKEDWLIIRINPEVMMKLFFILFVSAVILFIGSLIYHVGYVSGEGDGRNSLIRWSIEGVREWGDVVFCDIDDCETLEIQHSCYNNLFIDNPFSGDLIIYNQTN